MSLPSDHPLWDVWESLCGIWPAMRSTVGEEPTREWIFACAELSAADFGVGIQAAAKSDREFPPTPGQFVVMCGRGMSAIEGQQRRQAQGTATGIEFNPSPEYRLEQMRKLREVHGI